MIKNKELDINILHNAIIEGVFKKKAKDVIEIDLRKVENSICNYFIICHGESNTQVRSIAESIEEQVIKNTNEKPLHKEGVENSQWILLDFVDIVVHVFQREYREFYKLEGLWADGKVTELKDIEILKK